MGGDPIGSRRLEWRYFASQRNAILGAVIFLALVVMLSPFLSDGIPKRWECLIETNLNAPRVFGLEFC
jgi:hypothetical protein